MSNKKEVRSSGEIRAAGDSGEFEGYITVWDTVDDYESTFIRGAFTKTIAERGSKIKVFYNHTDLIGRATEIREDDHGVFVKGQLNLESRQASEVHSFMKDGTLEGLSFGFRTIKQTFNKGITEIREVKLYEFGPVTFPANDDAAITSVRSEHFDESVVHSRLYGEAGDLELALRMTLSDIWCESENDDIIAKFDEALSKHHAAYLDYAHRFISVLWSNGDTRSNPFANDLSNAMHSLLTRENKSIEDIATTSSFTKDELNELRQGNLIDNRDQLGDLSEEILKAHREQRNSRIELLCKELRGSLTNSEKQRINALIIPAAETRSQTDSEIDDLLLYFKSQNKG